MSKNQIKKDYFNKIKLINHYNKRYFNENLSIIFLPLILILTLYLYLLYIFKFKFTKKFF